MMDHELFLKNVFGQKDWEYHLERTPWIIEDLPRYVAAAFKMAGEWGVPAASKRRNSILVRYYVNGTKTKDLAAEYGVCRGRIFQLKKKGGWIFRRCFCRVIRAAERERGVQ